MLAEPVEPSRDVERLRRWIAAGGEWRVLAWTSSSVTVALVTCFGGEEMERIASVDPSFASYVDASEH